MLAAPAAARCAEACACVASYCASRAVQRSLADVALLEELLLALEFPGRSLLRGTCGLQLRGAGGGGLLGGARVEPQQDLTGLHRIARLRIQRDDRAGDLCGDRGLAHRLNDAVEGAGVGGAARRDRRSRQRLQHRGRNRRRVARAHAEGQQCTGRQGSDRVECHGVHPEVSNRCRAQAAIGSGISGWRGTA